MSEPTTEQLINHLQTWIKCDDALTFKTIQRLQSLTEENERLKEDKKTWLQMDDTTESCCLVNLSDKYQSLTTENAKLTEALDEVEIYVREITRLQKVLPGEQYSSLIEMETKEALSTIRKAREQNGH